jgi:peptidoglycan-N-acetylglucosamine deacetylase
LSTPLLVAFTVDLEPDCPPFLRGFRGVEEGLPALLDLLEGERVPATFFTTGEVARRYANAVRRLVREGHELGCHGMSHSSFASLTREAAREEIEQSAAILRMFAPVTSFRAPYLRLPPAYVPLLERAGFELDSSQAKYKLSYYRASAPTSLTRIPASVTSSVLRLPRALRGAYLAALGSPVVLFVHPWEFVDLTRERIRFDCRFRTGSIALDCVRGVLRSYARRGARFVRLRELSAAPGSRGP